MKKLIIIAGTVAGVILAGWLCYFFWLRPTRIALVNFPTFQVAKMSVSNNNRWVKLYPVSMEDFDKVKKADAVLVFAMGIPMTDEHRLILNDLINDKIPIHSVSVTDPVNHISNLDSSQQKTVEDYLGNGGTKNLRSLFNYIRQEVIGKKMFSKPIEPVVEIKGDVLFYKEDDQAFNSVKEFEAFYQQRPEYDKNNPKIALIVGFAGPFDSNKDHLDTLIHYLEQEKLNVYPISSFTRRLELLEEINPQGVIYLPHGRLNMFNGDKSVEWLQQHNIPLFCPITLNETHENWLKDVQGMAGGFLNQSVTMPEIDGGLTTMALNALFKNHDGLYLFKVIPEKGKQFCKTVANHIRLQTLPNKDKKIAIYYYKGPGRSALDAAGLEVVPSLYALLRKLSEEGYTVKGLPDTEAEFEKLIMDNGTIFGNYAEGNIEKFLNKANPALVSAKEYQTWIEKRLGKSGLSDTLYNKHGGIERSPFAKDGKIAVSRIEFGNIVLLPQPTQGSGENSFEVVHGANPVPPHHYLASYLWCQEKFHANAMIHFGTHGSLEFIPGKQIALSNSDWTDRIVYHIPHFYLYTIANVGEGMIAKRRSYAELISHLTAPFMETQLRKQVQQLIDHINQYLSKDNPTQAENLKLKRDIVAKGIHRDLRLDSTLSIPYTQEQLLKVINFAEEISNEKITGQLYILGQAFSPAKIHSSVVLLASDPIAYGMASLDKHRGKITQQQLENQSFFNIHYLQPAKNMVEKTLRSPNIKPEQLLSQLGISQSELSEAKNLLDKGEPLTRQMMNKAMNETKKSKGKPKHPSWIPKIGTRPKNTETTLQNNSQPRTIDPLTPEERDFCASVIGLYDAIRNIRWYRTALQNSPHRELESLLRALSGGYISPSSGGDFIANPNTLPTGRNLYSINAESTPSAHAWNKGVEMAKRLLKDYAEKHENKLPEKVSITLWSSSFIESEGASIAQILYLLGCEPIRDQFGRVLDIRLIPEEELKRPRIDVVVQTSGQFRDLAASRLSLIQKAVDLASKAKDTKENYVSKGCIDAERVLLEKGFSPKEARKFSSKRIFGGLNGMYGTGITDMVESSDRWDSEKQIADVYLNNMGAIYGNKEDWGKFQSGIFEAALQNTSVVIQPRQSNTWGALSLDHIYEFMGGLSLTVRNVTGNDPDAYFNDLRNHYKVKIQEVKEAVGVEARTTLLNDAYIKEKIKGGATTAESFAETFRNIFGWNVMKPTTIDQALWNELYDVYIKDSRNLGIEKFFTKASPAAMQEMTAVMLESIRKGYWQASQEQINTLANKHARWVIKHEAACSGFVCNNSKLKNFIYEQLSTTMKQNYEEKISEATEKLSQQGKNSIVMKKNSDFSDSKKVFGSTKNIFMAFGILCIVSVVVLAIVKIRKKNRK